MHDGPAWPLHLEPVDMPLSSTWLTLDMVGGDRLGECMLCGHSHADALELSSRMSDYWNQGMEIFSRLENGGEKEKAEQQSVAGALALQFESGRNILRFYQLRDLLAFQTGDPGCFWTRWRPSSAGRWRSAPPWQSCASRTTAWAITPEAEGFNTFRKSWRGGPASSGNCWTLNLSGSGSGWSRESFRSPSTRVWRRANGCH